MAGNNQKRTNNSASKELRINEKVAIQEIKNLLFRPQAGLRQSQLNSLHYLVIYILMNNLLNLLNFQNYVNDFFINNDSQLQSMLFNQLAISETLSGFLIVLSKDRNFLYVSENVYGYLKLKSIQVLLSCDRFDDVLHRNDVDNLKNIFKLRHSNQEHVFYCSWNNLKIKRRMHAKENYKNKIKINGRFIANGNLFVATCTPFLNLDNREYLVSTSPTCFTTVHGLDLKFFEICEKGQNILDYNNRQIENFYLYDILHFKDLDLICKRHKIILNTKSVNGQVDLVKILKRDGAYVNCLINMYYSGSSSIICKYQLLSSNESDYYEKNFLHSKNILSDNISDCGEDSCSLFGLSPINIYTECNQQYPVMASSINNDSQRAKKRKNTKNVQNNNKRNRFSVDNNTDAQNKSTGHYNLNEIKYHCVREPVASYSTNNSYLNSLQIQDPTTNKPIMSNYPNSQLANLMTSTLINNNAFMSSNIEPVQIMDTANQLVGNSMYSTIQKDSTAAQNNEIYLNGQQNPTYYTSSPSNSLCSEMENSSIENNFRGEFKLLFGYLNQEDYK